MSARNISTELALRFVAGAFRRGDYARALFWMEVAREQIEAHADGRVSHKRRHRKTTKAQPVGFARTFAHPRDAQNTPAPSLAASPASF